MRAPLSPLSCCLLLLCATATTALSIQGEAVEGKATQSHTAQHTFCLLKSVAIWFMMTPVRPKFMAHSVELGKREEHFFVWVFKFSHFTPSCCQILVIYQHPELTLTCFTVTVMMALLFYLLALYLRLDLH